MAQFEQMVAGKLHPIGMVGEDRRSRLRLADLAVDQHHRLCQLGKLDRGPLPALIGDRQDEAVNAPTPQEPDHGLVAFGIAFGVGEDHGVARLVESAFRPEGNLGEKRVGDVAGDEPHCVGRPPSQARGEKVGFIPDCGNGVVYLASHELADVGVVVEHS